MGEIPVIPRLNFNIYRLASYLLELSEESQIDRFKKANELIPIEIKAAKTFNKEFLKNIRYFHGIVGEQAGKGYLVYSGEQEPILNNVQLLNYRQAKLMMD